MAQHAAVNNVKVNRRFTIYSENYLLSRSVVTKAHRLENQPPNQEAERDNPEHKRCSSAIEARKKMPLWIRWLIAN